MSQRNSPDHSTRELEIQQSDNILWMFRRQSVVSERCLQQLTLAVQNHKRILPILPPAEASALPELGQQTSGYPRRVPSVLQEALCSRYPTLPAELWKRTWIVFAAE